MTYVLWVYGLLIDYIKIKTKKRHRYKKDTG